MEKIGCLKELRGNTFQKKEKLSHGRINLIDCYIRREQTLNFLWNW